MLVKCDMNLDYPYFCELKAGDTFITADTHHVLILF